MDELKKFEELLVKISLRVDSILSEIDKATGKFTLTQEQGDDLCRHYCKFPVMYCFDGKDTIIEGIERHCKNCPLVKGARHESD